MSVSRRPRRQTVAIVGTGLIGTSIGLALVQARAGAIGIAGWDVRKTNLTGAMARGGITRRARSIEDALTGAEIIVVACPLEAIQTLLPRIVAAAGRNALILEVGGVKAQVVGVARRALRSRPDLLFVAGHPMAGSERSGPAHSHAGMFAGRPFALVTPAQRKRASALSRAGAFARMLGAVPVRLSAREHDRLVAGVSALPQLASVALALAVNQAAGPRAKQLAGTGYRDATRLAGSPFSIWKSVLTQNRASVTAALRCLAEALDALTLSFSRRDDAALARLFLRAAAARRRVVAD